MELIKEKKQELIEKVDKTYLTKEDLIMILQKINFKKVEDLRFKAITGYNVKYTKDDEPYVQTLGFVIDIH